eukprot:495515-Alexandrium_andersonii.AAC.1
MALQQAQGKRRALGEDVAGLRGALALVQRRLQEEVLQEALQMKVGNCKFTQLDMAALAALWNS